MVNYSGKLRQPMVDGVAVRMGGEEFIIPALNFQVWQELDETINEVQKSFGKMGELSEARPKIILVVSRAMRINYPDISDEQVKELLDLRNMMIAWCAAIGVDYKPKAAGEKPAGEAPAAIAA